MKKVLFTFLMILFAFIIFTGVAEIMFRLTRGNPLAEITQSSENNRSLFKPNSVLESESAVSGEFKYTAHMNSFGYRGSDFSYQKEPGKLRIFAVGDSFTFGVGSEDSQTIPAVVEAVLKDQGKNVEVINAGIGHESPIRHLYNLKNIHLQYHPDMVVLLFDMTDLWDDWYWDKHSVKDKNGEVISFDLTYVDGKRDWWRTLAQHSAFCKWINNKIVRSFQKWQILGTKSYADVKKKGMKAKAVVIAAPEGTYPDEVVMEYDGLLLLRGKEKKRLIDKNWVRTSGYIKQINDVLKKENIPLVVAMYPHGIYVDEKQWHEGRPSWGFEQNKVYTDYYPFELMDKFCQKENIPFINTLPDFLKAPKAKYFFDWDGHMTTAGYHIVGTSIAVNPLFEKTLTSLLPNEVEVSQKNSNL